MASSSAQQRHNYSNLVRNFAARELKGKFKGSVLGRGWSLLNPLFTLAVYATIFGFFLKFPPPLAGNGRLENFAIYLFTALVVWNYFNAVVTGSMNALLGAGQLLKKIYFPPWTPILGNALATMSQLGIELGLLTVIYIVVGNVSWTFLLVPVMVVLLTAFSLGLGLVLSILNARLRDVNYIVTVVLNLAFYLAPIIYPISLVRQVYENHPWARIYEYNPLVQFVEGMKDLMYSHVTPSFTRLLYLTVVSFGTLALGAWFFSRNSRDIAEEL
jgi:ABC-type polysaccharide/polyol phosphate export permease